MQDQIIRFGFSLCAKCGVYHADEAHKCVSEFFCYIPRWIGENSAKKIVAFTAHNAAEILAIREWQAMDCPDKINVMVLVNGAWKKFVVYCSMRGEFTAMDNEEVMQFEQAMKAEMIIL